MISRHFQPAALIFLLFATAFVPLVTSNVIFAQISQIPGAVPAEPTMEKYENAQLGFSIEHPIAWIPVEGDPASAIETGVTTVTFVSLPESPQDQFAETLSVYVEDLAQIMTLEEFSASQTQVLGSVLQNATLVEESANATLAGKPAHMIVYDSTLNTTMTQEPIINGRVMEIWTLDNNDAYVIHFESEASKYDQFLDQANRMIDSFKLTTQTASSTANATSTSVPISNVTDTNMTATASTGNASEFEAAREQLLSDWQQTPFGAAFSTFIEPGSDQGYGVYTEHRSRIFNPDDTVTLYLEPVGFSHKQVVGEQGEELYQINLTASVQISQNTATNPSALAPLNQTISDIPPMVIVSHRQNTELYLTMPVYLYQAQPPVPEGDYTISYTITDGETGRSFTIQKDITVAQTVTT